MKLENITPHTKINSKWIKDLTVTPETIKLIEENIGRTLNDINQSKILYDPPPRVMEIKTKINKWDLGKLKRFLHSKGNYKQGEKTTLRMGENNSKWNIWQRINSRKTNNPIKKWAEVLEVSPKKTYRLLINTWKYAQHCSLLQKCKSKLQWSIISHWSEWPSSKVYKQ